MKNKKDKVIKDFKAVEFMREVRDKISIDIKDMDFEQIKKYFKKENLKYQNKKLNPIVKSLSGAFKMPKCFNYKQELNIRLEEKYIEITIKNQTKNAIQ